MTDLDDLLVPRLLDVDPQPAFDAGRFDSSLLPAIEHAHGTEDPVYAAMPHPALLMGTRLEGAVDDVWLPEGHHWDLHIEHRPLESAGPFTGGGDGLCWHTTQSRRNQVDLMWQVLRDKRAAPEVLIGTRPGILHPIVIQCQPLDMAGRALEHPPGTPETNRANKRQVEVCGFTEDAIDWELNWYQALANLFVLITHRVPIPNRAHQDFSDPARMGGQEWVDAQGHMDHAQCPRNTHTDIFRMREGLLINLIDDMPSGGYDL